MNPTFGDTKRTIESYLIDLQDNLYDREVRIEFIHKLRDEIKFNNAEELSKQVFKDIKQAKAMLKVEATTNHG